ncbi:MULTISPECIES: hypothetical protein [unclassified Sphingopyxis]|uniref:hypothetical protein n=1 Tax=unclassified Sphingopyxis TaxID=2614943 RepID=UPI00285689E4|nr:MULTISPECIES: hypothetical protein [unclassified Sphingopyxis]MDR6832102.1 hypothetical protein [Sphingopyxis sp. BE122]MDR7227844.1 hypothetical protein [Sphingopyxis sp. BE259]
MKIFSQLDLIAAHKWRRATFTTYSFSASFTEAVLVEALLRQSVSDITILTDPLGYRMALKERGAVRIGREYAVHPVAARAGCFHPKLMVLESDDATHATVGSGNLTFGGWSANLECLDHVHANGMALAVGDLGRFFTVLGTAQTCEHDARTLCEALGARLSASAAAGRDEGSVRIISSMEAPIAEQLTSAAKAIGGARSLSIASPYWDAVAIEELADALGVAHVEAHVPRTRVPAPKDMDWPRRSAIVRPVELTNLVGQDEAKRGLHAKIIEIGCAEGRLILSGSANATSAGLLYGGAGVRNVELCTLRVDRRTGHRWKFTAVKAPPKQAVSLEDDDDGAAETGILVAAHTDGGIHGRILTPWRTEQAVVTMELNRRPIDLGTVAIKDGKFSIPMEKLDQQAELSLEGRIQLRLVSGEGIAEGFVIAPDFGSIKSRAGKALPSMLAVMRGMQTPEHVLALMEFVRTNPEILNVEPIIASRGTGSQQKRPDPLVDAARVGTGQLGGAEHSGGNEDSGGGDAGKEERAWRQFVARFLRSMATATPAAEDDEDEADRSERVRRQRNANATDKLSLRLPELFQKLAGQVDNDVKLMNVARIIRFICVTTEDPATESLLSRILRLAEDIELGGEARAMMAWCIAYLAAGGTEFDAAKARGRMLKLGIDPDCLPDDQWALPGLVDFMAPGTDALDTLKAIQAARTIYDDVRALETALEAGQFPSRLTVLPLHEMWPQLLDQCQREAGKRRVQFVEHPVKACRRCSIAIPDEEANRLRSTGLCEARCHGFILTRNP